MEAYDPPFRSFYKALFDNHLINGPSSRCSENNIDAFLDEANEHEVELELPLIDLSRLKEDGEECKREMAEAAQEWGFFQVVNHGVSLEVLEKMRCEQVKAFKKPFEEKVNGIREFDFLAGSYRWGTPSATCLRQLAWSEAFHVPLTELSTLCDVTTFSTTMKQYAKIVSALAEKLAEMLAEKLGQRPAGFFKEKCVPSTCYIRMSRYPLCPISGHVFGLMPHTDSSFLTILHQDHVGGLQLLRDGKWIPVNPKQGTLFIMVGDLFQAWSNDVYKSVEHRVIANKYYESRYSIAYFLCPSYETVIEGSGGSSTYRRFSFGEFREQVQEDVKRFGHKVGLPRFINL